jgi:hypothetical protein
MLSSPGVFVVTAATSIASDTTLRVATLGGTVHPWRRRWVDSPDAAAGCRGEDCHDRREQNTPLAPTQRHAIRFSSVMSASVKPRLAGRQPSNRGGVPRVIDQVE